MRLLLAEDEKSLARATAVILERNNYTVDVVYDGAAALDSLEESSYDGVIMDIMMPKLDGISALKKLRDKKDLTPVLLLTAKSEIDDKVLGLDSGANDYLTKPFAAKELLARIRAMTRSAESQPDPSLSYGNISLDCTTFELSSPTGSFRLANNEYRMIEMMLRHPKHQVSNEYFMERIWANDPVTDKRVVWVYVSYLQKKLEALQADIRISVTENACYSLEEIQ